MSQSDIHFEVFRRPDPHEDWALHDVANVREKALAMATDLLRADKSIGVKVVKQYHEGASGDHFSLTIYEEGHRSVKLDPAAEDSPPVLPCFKPEDLYTQQARTTLARLLREFLAHHRITVSELIHRADCLTKLETAGTVFQHAVQKVAVAQAASTNVPVQQIIKALHELGAKAIARVQRDHKRGHFPAVEPGGFGALAVKLANERDGLYVFGGALARHLAPFAGWSEKLSALLALLPEAPREGAGHAMFFSAIDAVAAEIVANPLALRDLIGESATLGEALSVLAELLLGTLAARGGKFAALAMLSYQFNAGELPETRVAIGNRIIVELKSGRRLCPNSRLDELAFLREIARSLAIADPRSLNQDSLTAAFTLRSRRLVTNEALVEYLASTATPDEKIERLLFVEEHVIGSSNKKQLASILQQTLRAQDFADYFVNSGAPVMGRLRRLADLQARARRSGVREELRDEFAECLDRIATEIESRGNVLRTIEENMPDPAERAMAVLKLCIGNALTEGRVRGKARDVVLSALSQPGFLKGFLALLKGGEAPDQAMAELAELLELAGISREDGLKAIAA